MHTFATINIDLCVATIHTKVIHLFIQKISSCEFFKSKNDSFETTSSVNNLNIVTNANDQCKMSQRKSLVPSYVKHIIIIVVE